MPLLGAARNTAAPAYTDPPRQSPRAGGATTFGGRHLQARPSATASRSRRSSSIFKTWLHVRPLLPTSDLRRNSASHSRLGYLRKSMSHLLGQGGKRTIPTSYLLPTLTGSLPSHSLPRLSIRRSLTPGITRRAHDASGTASCA